jgi:D-amino-acid dehydrogenase
MRIKHRTRHRMVLESVGAAFRRKQRPATERVRGRGAQPKPAEPVRAQFADATEGRGHVRLIVVGSGIVGSSCALTAATLGADVTLVDADHRGRATSAGAGIICPWSSNVHDAEWIAFACAAARAYPALIDSLADLGEPAVGYRQTGAMVLTESPDRQAEIRGRLLARRGDAPEIGEIRALDPSQARGLFPPLSPEFYAVHISGGARVDGRLISAAMRRAAGRSGATVVAGEASLHVVGGRARGVVVDGELIEADAVVAATGAWTNEFLALAGLRIDIAPQRGQIVHIGLGLTDTSRWPAILPDGSGHYMLAFDDSRVVVGATRETGSGFDYRVTPGGVAEVLGQALRVAPGLASGTYLETRIGFRPMGPDIRPLLGRLPHIEGLVIATGLGASGLTMGPYAGEVAARVALSADIPVDLAPFDPIRN